MDLSGIAAGLYFLPLHGSNAYLLVDASGVTLVDTGPLGSGPSIRSAIEHLDLRPERLRQIVLPRLCGRP